MPDDQVNVRVTANADEFVKTFKDIPEVIQEASQQIADAGGNVQGFVDILESAAKSGIPLTKMLTDLAEGQAYLGGAFKDASAWALKEIDAINALAAANIAAAQSSDTLTDSQIAAMGAQKRIRNDVEKFEAAAVAATEENTARTIASENKRIAAINSELAAVLKAEAQKRAAFESALAAIAAETSAVEKAEAQRIAAIDAELEATLKANAQKIAAFESSVAAIQAERAKEDAAALKSAEFQEGTNRRIMESNAALERMYAALAVQEATYEIEIAEVAEESSNRVVAARGRATVAARLEGAAVYALGRYLVYGVAFGAGIAVEKEEQQILSLQRLSVASGESVSSLSQLRGIFDEVGASSDKLDAIAQRLTRSIEKAKDPTSKQAAEFKALGVTIDSSKNSTQTFLSILPQLAAHFRDSSKATQDWALLTDVATRNSKDLDAILRLTPSAMQAIIDRGKELGKSREEAASSADFVRQAERELGDDFKILADKTIVALARSFVKLQIIMVQLSAGFKETKVVATDFISAIRLLNEAADKSTTAGIFNPGKALSAFKEAKEKIISESTDTVLKLVALDVEAEKKIQSIFNKFNAAQYSTPTGPGSEFDPSKKKKDRSQEEELQGEVRQAKEVADVAREGIATKLSLVEAANAKEIEGIENVFARELAVEGQRHELAILRAGLAKDIAGEEFASTVTALIEERALLQAKGEDYTKVDNQITDSHLRYAKTVSGINAGLAKADARYAEETVIIARKTSAEIEKIAAEMYKATDALAKRQAAQKLSEQIQEIKNEEDHIKGLAKVTQEGVTELYNEKRISKTRELEALKESYDKEYAALDAELKKELRLIVGDGAKEVKERERIGDQITKNTQAENLKRMQLDAQIAKEQLAIAKSVTEGTIKDWANATTSIILGQKTIAQAFRQAGAQMLSDWVKTLEQILIRKIESTHAIQAVETALSKFLIFLHLQDAAATKASDAVTNTSKIVGLAPVAEAGAFAFGSPFGPEIAAADAAAAGAVMAGFAAQAAAISGERGAVLPNQNTIGFLHPKEMVLPRNLSEGIQGAINGGGFGGGGGTNISFSPRISALDGAGIGKVLQGAQKDLEKMVRRQLRAANR